MYFCSEPIITLLMSKRCTTVAVIGLNEHTHRFSKLHVSHDLGFLSISFSHISYNVSHIMSLTEIFMCQDTSFTILCNKTEFLGTAVI